MNHKNFSSSQAKKHRNSTKFVSQCETFKHLGVSDSLKYNWAKRYTESQKDAAAEDIAETVNKVEMPILILLAESPTTSKNTLEVLAYNKSAAIRQAVADNPRTSRETLLMLAKDEDAEVRYAMAENHNLMPEILALLTDDDNPFVKSASP